MQLSAEEQSRQEFLLLAPPTLPLPKGKGKGHVFTLYLKNCCNEGSWRGAFQGPFTFWDVGPDHGLRETVRPVPAQSKALTAQEGSRTCVHTYRCAWVQSQQPGSAQRG